MTAPTRTPTDSAESNPLSAGIQALIFFVAFFIVLGVVLRDAAQRTGGLETVPELGDGQDYDMLGFSLSKGWGFGNSWEDPEWREPYVRDNASGKWSGVLARTGPYTPTTSRPPALSFALSIIYRTAGRDFRVWRVIGAVLFASAAGLLVLLSARLLGGIVAGVALLALIVHDDLLLRFAAQYMTEPIAFACLALLIWFLFCFADERRMKFAALTGLTLGALVLTRSIFIIWYPFVLVLIVLLARPVHESARRHAALAGSICLLLGLAVVAPWGIRNSLLLRSFMPMGTQGGLNLPYGYSQYAVASDGAWTTAGNAVLEPFMAGLHSHSPIDREREMAKLGTSSALSWVRNNPSVALRLSATKARRLWDGHSNARWPILLFAVIGLATIPPRYALVLSAFLLANTVSVAMTHWVTDYRFAIPMRPALFMATAAGIAWCAARLFAVRHWRADSGTHLRSSIGSD